MLWHANVGIFPQSYVVIPPSLYQYHHLLLFTCLTLPLYILKTCSTNSLFTREHCNFLHRIIIGIECALAMNRECFTLTRCIDCCREADINIYYNEVDIVMAPLANVNEYFTSNSQSMIKKCPCRISRNTPRIRTSEHFRFILAIFAAIQFTAH